MYPAHPVILVHGLNDRQVVFKTMANHLSNLGWSVYSLNLTPNNGQQRLEILAEQLHDYINYQFKDNQSIDLIGFSMGGLVTRYYLQRLGGIERVKRYINISAPNRGTVTAYLLPSQGIVQMRPESAFLADLNRDYHLITQRVRVTTIWTPWDLMIVPAVSSSLGIGKEVIIPVTLHPWMLSDRRVLHFIINTLREPIL
ncbi:MAG: alpha/beta fold hydrolase [Gloeocapsa sp. DLM2.Bin57]|nr:MAG: alpha/beta fold hydrolase [Gloeocapsa sp. DLM2.Bin57]